MKFDELKVKIKDGTLNVNTDIVWKTVSILEQRQIIENILNLSIVDSTNGLKKIDFVFYEIFRITAIIEGFTDIEIDISKAINEEEFDIDIDKVIDLYDTVVQDKDLRVKMDITACNFNELLESSKDQELKIVNSIENILSIGINKIVEKFPDNKELGKLMGKVPGLINKINPEKLSFIKDAINFNNGVKENK